MAESSWVAGSILAKLKLDTTQFEKGAGAAAKGTGALAKEATKAHSAFSGLWKQMLVGIGATSLISKGIGFVKGQISDTIRVGREFEKQWANATTQMNLSAGAMDSMRRELLSLSPTLGSATDLAHGMYEVISAGIPAGKAIQFLGDAAKAAKAGFTDSFTAIDALTTVINAYGKSAEDATDVSDMMFESVKRGKQTYEEMAGALGTVVPIASQVGVGFDQVAAAMATLTRQGIDANTATVQLRQILVSVLNPSREAEKTAKALGIQFNVSALQAKGLGGFLEYVKEKTNGDAEALSALFGNVRALTGVMALGGAQSRAYAGDLDAIRNSAGQTELAFQKQMKTLDFWLTTAKNTFEKLKIAFYEGFAGPLKEGITNSKQLELQVRMLQEQFEDFGRQVGKVFKFVMDNAEVFWASLRGPAAWATAMAERASGISGMKKEMLEARIAAEDWAKQLTNLNISQDVLADNFGRDTKEGAKWRAEMEKLNDELEAQKGNLYTLGGAMVYAKNHMTEQVNAILETSKTSEEASARIRELRDSMKAGGQAAKEGAGALDELDEAAKKYKERLDELLDSLGINAEKNGELIDTDRILHALYESGKISLEKFTAAHKKLVDQMFEYGETIETPITQTRALGDIFNQVKGSAEDVYYGVEDLEDRFRYFAGELGISVAQLLDFQYELKRTAVFLQTGIVLPDLDFSVFYTDPKSGARAVTNDISNSFDGLYNDIATGFGNSASGLIGDIFKGMNFISGEFWKAGVNFKKAFEEAFDAIKEAFFRMIGEMTADWVLKKFKKLFEGIKDSGKDAADGIASSMKGAAGSTAASFLGAIGMIIGAFTAFIGLIGILSTMKKLTAEERSEFDRAYEEMQKKKGVIVAPSLPRKRTEEETEVHGQYGLDMIVSRPTPFMAGEGFKPERVTITPDLQRMAGNIINVTNVVNLDGTIVTDREYMRTRLMPEFLAALNSNEFKNQAQRALGIA